MTADISDNTWPWQGGVWRQGVAPGVSGLRPVWRPPPLRPPEPEGGPPMVPGLPPPRVRPPLPGLSGAHRWGQTVLGMFSVKTNILMTQFPARVVSFVSGGSSGTRPASLAPTAWWISLTRDSTWKARWDPAPVVLFRCSSRIVSVKKYQRLSQFCCPSLYHFPMPLILINVFQSAQVSVRVPLSFSACSHTCRCWYHRQCWCRVCWPPCSCSPRHPAGGPRSEFPCRPSSAAAWSCLEMAGRFSHKVSLPVSGDDPPLVWSGPRPRLELASIRADRGSGTWLDLSLVTPG